MKALAATLLLLISPLVATASDALVVKGDVLHELHLNAAAIRDLPHVDVTATDGHSGLEVRFRGVWLSELLSRAGVVSGEKLRGRELATYILMTASDGYRVVFSLGEVDAQMAGSEAVLVADAADGKPLDGDTGPLRLVVPRDTRPARWVRKLTTIQVAKVP